MSTQPIPTNPTATVVNTVIDGVFTASVSAAETAIKTAVPWLGWPIIGTIVNFIVNSIANKIYQYFSLCVTFAIIDVQVSGQVSDFNLALSNLKKAQASGDKNAIAKALSEFKTASESLTHWDGGANPGSL